MMSISIASTAPTVISSKHLAELEHRIAELCVGLSVSIGAAGLAAELSSIDPDLAFRDVLSRGGWYRLGGVVDSNDHHCTRVSDDLAAWGEQELAAHGDDVHALADAHAGSSLWATRLSGKTHYLVASTGSKAGNFIQIEIEELQETLSHPLFPEGASPGSLEELFEAPGEKMSEQTLGLPFFSLRRVTDVAGFLARMAAQRPEPHPIHRFFEAWQVSSAGNTTHFCNHWVLAIREYLDRFRQPILQATPVVALNAVPPRFDAGFGVQGLALNHALQRFDRQVGYPMAWFFHMLTTKRVPNAVVQAVVDDVEAGFGYLPERDVSVLKNWLHRPFVF